MVDREIEEKLRKLAAADPEAHQKWLFYLSGDTTERREADELIDVLLFQQIRKDYREQIFLDPPSATACSGEYRLGTVLYPAGTPYGQFGLREEEWIKHVMINGMTGAGKTNLVFQILRELKSKGKPFLVFDWKRNYRDLLQLHDLSDTVVYTVGREPVPFRFNPLIPPPGTEPGQWLMKLVDVLKHAYFVGEGVEFLLRQAIDWVYEKCGYYDGSRRETPLFGQVRDFVFKKHLTGRMSLWKASALRVLESLCFRHGLGEVMNTDETWNWEQTLSTSAVLELDSLSDSDKVAFVETMILWIYELRKLESTRERFKHALVVEEGHHVLSRLKENVEGAETIMETCLRQIREFGEAVIVVDQEPSKLSDSIKANTYCRITFNLGNGKDIDDISKAMALDDEERDYLDWLDVGHAIVTLKGRVRVPLYVVFPRVDIKKGKVLDADLQRKEM